VSQNEFSLEWIGASRPIFETFQPYRARGLKLARVSAVYRDRYRVYTERGEMAAEIIGALRFRAVEAGDLPAVGDWVAVDPIGPEDALIHAVLPRLTKFSRRAAGARDDEQVIATNVDLVLIVCGLDHDFNVRRIERYLTLARESGAESAIVLNKCDLCADVAAHVEEVRRIAQGAPVLAISARSSEAIEPVLSLLAPGRTLALLGSSGVGKSTLMNTLIGVGRQRTAEVRNADNRGRHTTTSRELIPLARGGALIDTPGMRELQLWAGEDSVDSAFDDITAFVRQCRFRDCSHTGEEDCAVAAAIARGELDVRRFENYRKLIAEVRFHERQTDVHAARTEKQRWRRIHKAMRAYYKDRD
jgi:ribosome biogenesis GTPase